MYNYYFDGVSQVIIGGPQTGKTHKLVEKLVSLSKNEINNDPDMSSSATESDNASAPTNDNGSASGSAAIDASASGSAAIDANASTSASTSNKILVCCMDDAHAHSFKEKALLAGMPEDTCVEFSTVENIAKRIISSKQAHEITGRASHVLSEYEEKFLFEDMRTSAMKGRRLKEMMGFLYRQFSELTNEQEWGCTVEEQIVLKLLRENLNFSGGILRYELAGFALNVLEKDNASAQEFSYSHVLIDDFGLLDRGMQILALHLAKDSFSFSADTIQLSGIDYAFPYPSGVRDFIKENKNTQLTHLESSYQPKGLCKTLTKIRQNKDMQTYGFEQISSLDNQDYSDDKKDKENLTDKEKRNDEDVLQVTYAEDMGGELQALISIIYDKLQNKETLSIVGTNNIWLSNVARALKKADIVVELPPKKLKIKDFSDEHQCERIYNDAFALLQKDKNDGVAWRSILGLNDYVARSVGFMQLKDVCYDYHIDMVDALNALAVKEIKCQPKQKALQEIVNLYEQIKEKLDAQDKADTSKDDSAAQDMQAENDPKEGKLKKDELKEGGESLENNRLKTVLICRPTDLFGKHVDHVVFGGFVDGLIPSRAFFDSSQILGNRKKRTHSKDLSALYCAIGAAKKDVSFTYFTHASLPVAERLELCIEHIYFKDDMRMCNLRPSTLLQEISISTS